MQPLVDGVNKMQSLLPRGMAICKTNCRRAPHTQAGIPQTSLVRIRPSTLLIFLSPTRISGKSGAAT